MLIGLSGAAGLMEATRIDSVRLGCVGVGYGDKAFMARPVRQNLDLCLLSTE